MDERGPCVDDWLLAWLESCVLTGRPKDEVEKIMTSFAHKELREAARCLQKREIASLQSKHHHNGGRKPSLRLQLTAGWSDVRCFGIHSEQGVRHLLIPWMKPLISQNSHQAAGPIEGAIFGCNVGWENLILRKCRRCRGTSEGYSQHVKVML